MLRGHVAAPASQASAHLKRIRALTRPIHRHYRPKLRKVTTIMPNDKNSPSPEQIMALATKYLGPDVTLEITNLAYALAEDTKSLRPDAEEDQADVFLMAVVVWGIQQLSKNRRST